MFMNSLIHLFEATTLILVGVLIVQVYRCYLNSTRMERAQSELSQVETSARRMSVRINISSSSQGASPKPQLLVAEQDMSSAGTEIVDHCSASASDKNDDDAPLSSQEANSNGQILNDYIGEFFSEPAQVDIQAYKRPIEQEVSSAKETLEPEDLPIVQSLASSKGLDQLVPESESDEVIVVESQTKITPVILDEGVAEPDNLPVLTEMASIEELVEDDSIITVGPESDSSDPSDKVMSDKVVHAMLDEARLVCAS